MRRYSRIFATALLASSLCLASSPAKADGGAETEAKSAADLEKLLKKLKGGDDSDEEKPDFPPLDEVVKDMEKRSGFLTLYVNEEKHELYALFPSRLQGEPFLLAFSASRGPAAGSQWGDKLLQLERFDKKLLFVEPNTFQTASGTLEEVVERTYPPSIYASADILSVTGGGSTLIDLGALLKGMVGASWSDVVELTEAKAFPGNNEIELFFRPVGSGGWYTPAAEGVHFSFSRLPKSDFSARQADDRIGYFIEVQEDFSKDPSETTRFNRIIQRWHLKKADSSLKMSPPEEPLVFYIEKSVPIQYRKAVADGIREWNKAFEKVGLVDAIVVRQQTDSNEFADLDPEDARYNFFRWIASGQAYAIGPRRADPRTGQIYDADILFDEGMIRWWTGEFDQMVDQQFQDALSPSERRALLLNPWDHPNWANILDEYVEASTRPDAPKVSYQEFAAKRLGLDRIETAGSRCDLSSDLCRQQAFARMMIDNLGFADLMDGDGAGDVASDDDGAADASGDDETAEASDDDDKKSDDKKEEDEEAKKKEEEKLKKEREEKREALRERMLYEMVKGTVAHEVGHVLGLRHNFKASAWKTMEQIQNAKPGEPISASVMDYTAANLPTSLDFEAPFDSYVLGPYDMWAIEYGYAIPGQNDYDRSESKMLAAIADKVAQEGLAYSTDEDRWSPDPLVNVWDLSSEPLEFSKHQLSLADKAIANILKKGVDDDESYSKARNDFYMAFYEYFRASSLATRFVGGHYISRAHKGDPDAGPPITVVEAEKQAAAMDFLVERILSRDALKIAADPELQRHLAASRWSHRGADNWSVSTIFPIQSYILRLHKSVLYDLLSDDTIENLYDSARRVDADTELFTLPQMFERLTGAVFAEVLEPVEGDYSFKNPMIADIRRNLQREYVSRLIRIAIRDETSSQLSVARALAQSELERVNGAIKKALKGDALASDDAYTSAHLRETRRRIEQALDADFTINGGGGGAGSFLSFLFGQPAGSQSAEKPASALGSDWRR